MEVTVTLTEKEAKVLCDLIERSKRVFFGKVPIEEFNSIHTKVNNRLFLETIKAKMTK